MSPEQYGAKIRFQSRKGLRASGERSATEASGNVAGKTVEVPRSVEARAVQSARWVQRPPPLSTTIQPARLAGPASAGAGRKYTP